MNPPASVALHLGAHKTATTHLQSILALGAEALAANGVAFAGPRDLRGPGRTLFDRFPGEHRPTENASKRPPADELLALSGGAKRLILSEENYLGPTFPKSAGAALPLYPRAERRVARLAALLDPVPVTLFLAIRDPAPLLASLYGQMLMGGTYMEFDRFMNGREPMEFSWLDPLRRLAAVDGLAGIVVWRHEDYRDLQGRIFDAMADAAIATALPKIDRRAHEGLSERAVRQTLAEASAGKTGDLGLAAREAFPAGPDHPKFAPWSADELALSAHIYGLEVERIADQEGVTLLHP